MSLQKQIARNAKRQQDAYLKAHQAELVPGWQNWPDEHKSLVVNMSRHGITPQDIEKARKQGRDEAFKDTAPAVMKVAYAAFVLVLAEEYGYSHEDCYNALMKVDSRIALSIDSAEIVREMEDKVKIRFNERDGVARVEMIE